MSIVGDCMTPFVLVHCCKKQNTEYNIQKPVKTYHSADPNTK